MRHTKLGKEKLTLTIIPTDASDADLEALVAAWKKQAEEADKEKKQTLVPFDPNVKNVTNPSQPDKGASNQNT